MWDKKRITFAVGKKYSRVRESVCKKEKTHQESKWYHIAWVSKNNTHDEILTFAAPGLLSLESRAFRRDTLTHTKRTALYTDMFCYCYQQQLIHNHQMQNKCLTLFRSTEKSRKKRNGHRLVLLKYGTQFGIQKLAHEIRCKWREKLIGLRGWENSSHFHKNFNEPIVKRWITVENIRWQKWMNKKEKKEARPSNTNSKDMNPERTRKKKHTHTRRHSAKFKIWFISI